MGQASNAATLTTDSPGLVTASMHPEGPAWRAVDKLVDLVEIFDPGVQVCVWRRELDPNIQEYLSGLPPCGTLQSMETLSAEGRPRLVRLPAEPVPMPGRAAFIDDLAFLRDITCELLGCPAVGLRFARMHHAMCPGWHVDRTGMRMICTYQGPGTQWLSAQDADRGRPNLARLTDAPFIEAHPGDVVLLKGNLWQENEPFGAIHRSPEIPVDAGARTLVTLDPLW